MNQINLSDLEKYALRFEEFTVNEKLTNDKYETIKNDKWIQT